MTHTALSPKLRPVPAQQRSERKFGEVSEWLKEHAWKVCIRQRIEGSNPSLTAKSKKTDLRVGFLLSGKHLCRQVSQSHAVADHPRAPHSLQSPDGTSQLFVLQAPAPYLAFVIAPPNKRSFLSQQEQQDDCNAILWPQHAFFYGRYPAPINCSAIGFHFEKLILK